MENPHFFLEILSLKDHFCVCKIPPLTQRPRFFVSFAPLHLKSGPYNRVCFKVMPHLRYKPILHLKFALLVTSEKRAEQISNVKSA